MVHVSACRQSLSRAEMATIHKRGDSTLVCRDGRRAGVCCTTRYRKPSFSTPQMPLTPSTTLSNNHKQLQRLVTRAATPGMGVNGASQPQMQSSQERCYSLSPGRAWSSPTSQTRRCCRWPAWPFTRLQPGTAMQPRPSLAFRQQLMSKGVGTGKGKSKSKGRNWAQLVEGCREGRHRQEKVQRRWGSWWGLGHSLEGWGSLCLEGCSWLTCGLSMCPQALGTNAATPCQVIHFLLKFVKHWLSDVASHQLCSGLDLLYVFGVVQCAVLLIPHLCDPIYAL